MFSAPSFNPLAPAIADGALARIRGSLTIQGLPGMAPRTASLKISRRVER